jgi:hypothetical protein
MKMLFIKKIIFVFLLMAANIFSLSQNLQTLSLSPDSPRWEFQGQAKATEFLGRKSIYLNGGAAITN